MIFVFDVFFFFPMCYCALPSEESMMPSIYCHLPDKLDTEDVRVSWRNAEVVFAIETPNVTH